MQREFLPRLATDPPLRRPAPAPGPIDTAEFGRLHYSVGATGGAGVWRGNVHFPDEPEPTTYVFAVQGDERPGPDHYACAKTISRMQLRYAVRSLPLINDALRRMGEDGALQEDDLRLRRIELPAQPLMQAWLLVYGEGRHRKWDIQVRMDKGSPSEAWVALRPAPPA